ncbi:hypothetical protein [Streptomyces sp. NPDC058280]|uniref:hypothetical protein n=1 Tax=Streptomyces sp. NPDC058280 TaxID=3346419 RepID=UPI0036F17BE4
MTAALFGFGEQYGMHWLPANRLISIGHLLMTIGMLCWLYVLVGFPLRRLGMPLAAAAVGLGTVATNLPGGGAPRLGDVAFSLTLIWLAVEVCRRHGITLAHLGIAPPGSRTLAGRAEASQVAYGTVLSCLTVGLGAALIRWAATGLGLPTAPISQQVLLGLPSSPLDVMVRMLGTAVIEDLAVVAATTALLSAARRPAREIYTVIIAIEIAIHAYFGLPAFSTAFYAAYRVYLYRRHGRLTPMLIGHAAWDSAIMIGWFLPSWLASAPAALLLAGTWATEQYLTRRGKKQQATEPRAACNATLETPSAQSPSVSRL